MSSLRDKWSLQLQSQISNLHYEANIKMVNPAIRKLNEISDSKIDPINFEILEYATEVISCETRIFIESFCF